MAVGILAAGDFVAGRIIADTGDVMSTPTSAIKWGTVLIPDCFVEDAETAGWTLLGAFDGNYSKLQRSERDRLRFIERCGR